MKKIAIIVLIVLALAGVSFFLVKHTSLLSNFIQSPSSWKYKKTIATPITGKSTSNTDVTLGSISNNQVTLSIPKGAFDSDTNITLTNPAAVPTIAPTVIETIGAPIEILASTKTRLNDKATITFRFDPSLLPINTQADHLRVAYYDGTTWEYLKPINVDMTAKTMTFITYHFSIFGPSKLQNDSQITQTWIHTQAISNQLASSKTTLSNEMTGQMLKMTMEKMGITDPAVMQNVEENILQDKNYQKIAATYEQNNNTEAATEIAGIIGTKIAEHVPKAIFTNHTLKESGEFPGDTAAVAQAVGYLTEDNKTEAAKVIGEQIIDKFMIGVAGKIAVILTKTAIANWKDSEIEAAYTAFNNGSNAKFYGYNVDRGDFNAVWDQMRGIRRQLEIESVDRENDARKEAGMPVLTEAQEELVKENLKESYKEQFTMRSEKEADLTKEETKLKAIMDAFDKAGFLGVAPPAGLDKGLELENKLDILSHFAEKMMQDTGRPDISDKTGLLVDGKLSLEDLIRGAGYYFAADTEKGKADYTKFLQDRFGILPYPPLSKLTGAWKGSLTVTDVWVDPSLKDNKDELKKEGCDMDINFDDLKGKSNPIDFTLDAASDTAGTMNFTSGNDTKSIPITYSNGVIAGSYSEQGGTATMNLTASNNKDTYAIAGSMLLNFKDKIKITSSLTASR